MACHREARLAFPWRDSAGLGKTGLGKAGRRLPWAWLPFKAARMISARQYEQALRERQASGWGAARTPKRAGEPPHPELALRNARWKNVLARFWGHVDIGGEQDCWLWQSTIDKRGYGAFQVRPGKNVRAHRFAIEITNMAPIPSELFGLHSCDNPPCVNPRHLRIGTAADNMRDCLDRGRHPYVNRTHCVNGHAYDSENTYRTSGGAATLSHLSWRPRFRTAARSLLLREQRVPVDTTTCGAERTRSRMNRQRSYGQDGYVTVDVEAVTRIGDLPPWLDTRLIVDAALAEYRLQRTNAVGELPLPETADAFGDDA